MLSSDALGGVDRTAVTWSEAGLAFQEWPSRGLRNVAMMREAAWPHAEDDGTLPAGAARL